MATYRVANLLKSKSEFTDEEIERMSERDAWQWIRESKASGKSGHRQLPNDESHPD